MQTLCSDQGEQREPYSGDDRDGPSGLEWPRKGQDHDLSHPPGPLCRSEPFILKSHSLSLPDQNSSGKDSDVTVMFGWLSKYKRQPTGLGHHHPYKYVRTYIYQTMCIYLMPFSTSSTHFITWHSNLLLAVTLGQAKFIISTCCVLLKHNTSLVHIRD